MHAALLLLVPLLGALVVMLAPAKQAARIATVASLFTFVHSLWIAVTFEHWHDSGFGLTAALPMLSDWGITLSTGVDSVALLLVLLTTLIIPICVIGSYTYITERVKEYYAWLLVIQTAMLGVFMARDLIFFYICFELTLVPMYFLIAVWGGTQRIKAAYKFFIFTFTGSLLTLAGVIYIAWKFSIDPIQNPDGGWTFNIGTLTSFAATRLSFTEQAWLLLALMAGFAVKVPLFPLHTWLPLAHPEAPTAGSVILASILLKLGTYGMYRFVLPMLPDAVVEYAPAIAVLAIIGILYGALVCWVQADAKRLIAFSSISHLGFCVLGLFALNPLGGQGAVLYMLNHGLSTGALFLLIGMVYERYHTHDMNDVGGLSRRMPVWAFFMVFFVLCSVGLPGLNGFISEFLCLLGTFTATAENQEYPGLLGPWYAVAAGLGMIFAAMYLLLMTGKMVWGPLKEPQGSHGHGSGGEHGGHSSLPPDLSPREIGILVPLAVLCLYIGFQPRHLTDAIMPSVEAQLADASARAREVVRMAETSPVIAPAGTVKPRAAVVGAAPVASAAEGVDG